MIGALRVLFLLLFFVLFSARTHAQERITNFASDISIAADGTVTVRETIAVVAENDRIQRGILRDIPTVYTDRLGNRVRVGFDVTPRNVPWVNTPPRGELVGRFTSRISLPVMFSMP